MLVVTSIVLISLQVTVGEGSLRFFFCGRDIYVKSARTCGYGLM